MRNAVVYGPHHPDAGFSVVGERVHVLATLEQTGGAEAFIQEGPAGMGPPPHHHPWDEAFFMLEGEMDVTLGDRSLVLAPGAFVYIPAGTVHAFRYRTTGRFFSFTNGGMAARFFADLDQNAGEGSSRRGTQRGHRSPTPVTGRHHQCAGRGLTPGGGGAMGVGMGLMGGGGCLMGGGRRALLGGQGP